ncbi:MAG: ATP-binding protein [Pseudomonadota bacterium]
MTPAPQRASRDASRLAMGGGSPAQDLAQAAPATDELTQAHEQLRAAIEASQTIFDFSHDVICVFGPDGRFEQVNRHVERMWGHLPEEVLGRCYLAFIHPEDVEMTRDVARRIMEGSPTTSFTNRYLHKDGSVVPVMWSGAWSETHQRIFAIGRDMRQHHAAEERLRQAQKMETIGRLTGGVAHDFNNLLTVVIGAAEMLSEALADRPDLAAVAKVALEAAERGADLVGQLMTVSRTQSLAPQSIDCRAFLNGLIPMLSRTLPCDIEVTLDVAPGELCCRADPTQLTSALLNLCINARDAMPGGGRLTLGARRAAGPCGGEMVVLSVEDTGEGMSAQTRTQALEPFFTTKPAGKGSGLGLSMVYGFAAQSGGRMEIESEEGEGARVSIWLPRAARCPQVQDARTSAEPLPLGLKVLLVEDDDLVRAQAQRQLEGLGCRVRACADGHDALDVMAMGERVDLIVTDINMPGGLNGRQLADHARLLDPTLRILFTSGHTQDPILRSVGLDPRSRFLAKPYRRATLAEKLAELVRG